MRPVQICRIQFLVVTLVSLLRFIWPDMDIAFVELPLLAVYNILTLMRFFNEEPRWTVVLKTVLVMLISFLIIDKLKNFLIGMIYNA